MVKPSRCRTCGLPVTGYYEEGDLTTLTPCGHTFDARPPAEQTQLPPGSRPVQIEPTAYQRDIAAILTALGLSDHARDYSPHEVVQRDILPAIARLREPTREHFRTWPRDIPPSASSY